MIKYKLFCNHCVKNFDSWFGTSKEFEKLKKNKLLSCPNCNSGKIEKSLMSPSIINNKSKNDNLNSQDPHKNFKRFHGFVDLAALILLGVCLYYLNTKKSETKTSKTNHH